MTISAAPVMLRVLTVIKRDANQIHQWLAAEMMIQ